MSKISLLRGNPLDLDLACEFRWDEFYRQSERLISAENRSVHKNERRQIAGELYDLCQAAIAFLGAKYDFTSVRIITSLFNGWLRDFNDVLRRGDIDPFYASEGAKVALKEKLESMIYHPGLDCRRKRADAMFGELGREPLREYYGDFPIQERKVKEVTE